MSAEAFLALSLSTTDWTCSKTLGLSVYSVSSLQGSVIQSTGLTLDRAAEEQRVDRMDDFTLNSYPNLRLSLSLVLNQKAIVIGRDVCCQHTSLSSLSIVRIDPTPSVASPPLFFPFFVISQ